MGTFCLVLKDQNRINSHDLTFQFNEASSAREAKASTQEPFLDAFIIIALVSDIHSILHPEQKTHYINYNQEFQQTGKVYKRPNIP